MLDAAALAAILDPERKVPGWWKRKCQECGQLNAHTFQCRRPVIEGDWVFTGPPDLHTAREHNWRLEDWLLERGCKIYRNRNDGLIEVIREHEGWMCFPPNHTAALVGAIERIAHNG